MSPVCEARQSVAKRQMLKFPAIGIEFNRASPDSMPGQAGGDEYANDGKSDNREGCLQNAPARFKWMPVKVPYHLSRLRGESDMGVALVAWHLRCELHLGELVFATYFRREVSIQKPYRDMLVLCKREFPCAF